MVVGVALNILVSQKIVFKYKLTISKTQYINKLVNVEATWKQTGLGGSTPQLHHKHIERQLAQFRYLVYDRKKKQILIITRSKRVAESIQCAFDGAELGSTDMKIEWSLPDDCVIGQQL